MRAQDELTLRQQGALASLRRIPISGAPPLRAEGLRQPPWGYRYGPWGVAVTAGLIASIVVWPRLTIQQVWQGSLPLRSGSAIQLVEPSSETIRLPQGEGTLTLQGPARLAIQRLERRLITGRTRASLQLDYGDLILQVAPGLPKLLEIRTPLLAVRITGTEVLIGHRPDEGSRVLVVRGTVLTQIPPQRSWQPLPAGMVLTINAEGRVLRYTAGPLLGHTTSSANGRAGETALPRQSSPSTSPSSNARWPDLLRMLWREEE